MSKLRAQTLPSLARRIVVRVRIDSGGDRGVSVPGPLRATAKNLAAQAAGMNPEKAATVATAAAKRGMDLVDHDTHESLKVAVAEGRRVIAAARNRR